MFCFAIHYALNKSQISARVAALLKLRTKFLSMILRIYSTIPSYRAKRTRWILNCVISQLAAISVPGRKSSTISILLTMFNCDLHKSSGPGMLEG